MVLEAILDVAAGYNVLVLLLGAIFSAHFDTQMDFLAVKWCKSANEGAGRCKYRVS